MDFQILTRSKKKGGKFFILISHDSYGLSHIWGRFKKFSSANSSKVKLEKKYGG